MDASAQQRLNEAETYAYKKFMRVAKKISYMEYGKWQIVPDLNDPLRKFTLEKNIGWAILKVKLYGHAYWYGGNQCFKFMVAFTGLLQDKSINSYLTKSGLLVKPRMAEKLLKHINDSVIPGFFQDIEKTKIVCDQESATHQAFRVNVSKVKGLKLGARDWQGYNGELKGCTISMVVAENGIFLRGDMTFDEFEDMRVKMGWGI